MITKTKVLELVPTKSTDEILISLHENDYDVGKTIDFLFDGGDVTEDWQTVGSGSRKKQSSGANSSPNNQNENETHPRSKNRK